MKGKDKKKSRNYPWTGHSLAGLWGERVFYHFPNLFGRAATYFLIALAVPFFLAFRKRERRASFDFFSRVYRTSNPWRLLWHTYGQFWCWGACWADRSLIFGRGLSRYRFERRGDEHLNEALRRGKGLLLLTAHEGNYGIGAWMLRKATGRPITIALIDDEERQVRRFLDRIQGEARPPIISISRSFFSSVSILRVLRAGEIVGIQGDRVVGKGAIQVPFFGSPILLPKGPFLLSLLSGAPLAMSFSLKKGWKGYLVSAERPILPPPRGGSNLEPLLLDLAERAAKRIEEVVRDHPHQWFNFYPYWIDSPGFADTFHNLDGEQTKGKEEERIPHVIP